MPIPQQQNMIGTRFKINDIFRKISSISWEIWGGTLITVNAVCLLRKHDITLSVNV